VNQLSLQACIVESSTLRFTPAGLPALDLQLEHASELPEAGVSRQIRLTLKAIALGGLAERLAQQSMGSAWRFTGFLASSRNSKAVIFHIQEFKPD
jgi:primosomal replication protein N